MLDLKETASKLEAVVSILKSITIIIALLIAVLAALFGFGFSFEDVRPLLEFFTVSGFLERYA